MRSVADWIGKIERVDLRLAWSNEAFGFTPWLAEPDNLSFYIGEPLGLDLEVAGREHRVGPYWADILCSDKRSGFRVVIENQLERADHSHLGQLLTYAAGLKADIMIWIASRFSPEHTRALHLINELNPDRLRAFALELEVQRIGDSALAPSFKKIVAPENWRVATTPPTGESAKRHTECSQRRLEYWETFVAGLVLETEVDRVPKPNTLGNLRFSLKGRDLWITVYGAASLGRLGRIGVFVKGSPDFGRLFFGHQDSINSQFGPGLVWDDGEQWTISLAIDANPADRSDWQRQHTWLAGQLNSFLRIFKPYADGLVRSRTVDG